LNKIKRVVWFQLFASLGAIAIVVALCHVFPVPEILALIQQRVMGWGVWSAICYPILYACCNVLLLPGGVLIALIGNVTGAAISFLIGRTIGRRWLRRRLERSKSLHALEPAVEREGWKLILLSQLHPLFPTSLMNYLYGLTRIRFRTCMIWIAIGQAPGLFLYAYLGTLGQLGLRLARGQTHPRIYEYWVWGGGLLISLAILVLMGRIALRVLRGVSTI
jgi:membrane protein DedA with SNARE-associated domain